MSAGLFSGVSTNVGNPKWTECNSREHDMYFRDDDIRSEFARDYNRILHSNAYRRLKHKTQVFFATRNDHICTRIEHVNHVASVSYTIAKYLGLNTELTNAIALGHDLGHAPFGHAGETILKNIASTELRQPFWHERNSLRFIDKIETLLDPLGCEQNLNLTYAVRDGIISHCGEVDENSIFPREDKLELENIEKPNQYPPYTWEGSVVKISDKIAYLGRDIEDALTLRILSFRQLRDLIRIIKGFANVNIAEINNTVITHKLIINLCKSSSPETGIGFSDEYLGLINSLKEFSYINIYKHERLNVFIGYSKLILESIYDILSGYYQGVETLTVIKKNMEIYPLLVKSFSDWLLKYSNVNSRTLKSNRYGNQVLYDLEKREEYLQAVIDYISGMTDSFAIKVFNELTNF
ncbi:dNTP triphosphohydrolase [Desulfosporosinus fructosivorans]|uniref:DNTP triphosphohydrolase n=1 Tax=Desulfosporosinus fructosivorans TaxID=2018669 RepID=A0A4Z0QWR7_9FIRM|nr:dNTP triphosphohydrolase [Desulfosporosinus fructosivorans]TGE34948.1 dNTP triphosphohydrolase [Desulfosporosinus fructosivorans]